MVTPVCQNLKSFIKVESEAFKIRAYVTITKNLTEENIITDLHRDVTMRKGERDHMKIKIIRLVIYRAETDRPSGLMSMLMSMLGFC